MSPPPSPGDIWWARTARWPLRTESLADRRAVYTWMSPRCSDTRSHWDSYECLGHTHQYLKSAISVHQILSSPTHPCMKFNLFYEYYNKNTHNNIHVCVFHFGSSVCNSFKKNRAMGDHCTSVIYIYQFVIDSSEIQNFIWIGQWECKAFYYLSLWMCVSSEIQYIVLKRQKFMRVQSLILPTSTSLSLFYHGVSRPTSKDPATNKGSDRVLTALSLRTGVQISCTLIRIYQAV